MSQPDRWRAGDRGARVPGGRPNAEPGGGRADGAACGAALDLIDVQDRLGSMSPGPVLLQQPNGSIA
jgi:hypothetical protein